MGIGKQTSVASEIYADSNLPYVNESSASNIRNELGVNDRDVYIFDNNGNYIETINTNNSFEQSAFEAVINGLME